MHFQALSLALLGCVTSILALPTADLEKRGSRTTAPAGCLTVGSGGKYSTIGAAINALGSSTAAACIFIASGTYKEQLTINYKGKLSMYGSTTDTMSYKSNTVTITHTISSTAAGTLDKSSTVNVVSAGFAMYNINVANGQGAGTQAVAMTLNADKVALYACQVTGYQDTLYTKAGNQYIANSMIEGAVDFIFGGASVWLTNNDIVMNGGGSITASGRSTNDATWYVFDHCNIKAASSYKTTGKNFLGRPWRVDARVKFQSSTISNVINAAGWTTMAAGATPLYYEYGNTGAGASTSGRKFLTASSATTPITTVLGSGYTSWVKTSW